MSAAAKITPREAEAAEGARRRDGDGSKRHERRHVPGIVLPFLVRELFHALTPAEWMLWCCIYLHSNRDGFCCLKNETLISETGLGRNGFHRAKRGLVAKEWLENCGQRNDRGPNVYKASVHVPDHVRQFIDSLWDSLNLEKWWNSPHLEGDRFNYTDSQIDCLVAWRVIRVLRESGPDWRMGEITAELAAKAQDALLTRLRCAAKSLGPGRGMWHLWGDGFDEAVP
jgi:hypothetical protein